MERLRRHPRRMLLAALALAAAGVVLVAADAGFANVVDAASPLRADWLVIAFGAQVLAFAGYTLAYRRIIALLDGPRLGAALVVRLVMTGFGAFAPGGGFAIDYQAVKALDGDERAATVRVLALGALEYLVIAPAACIAAAAMLVFGSNARASVLWPWAFVVAVVIYRLLSFVLPMLPALWARQGVVHLIQPEEAAVSAEAGAG